VADAAAESLWSDAGLVARGYVGLQVHLRWQGLDSLATATTIARSERYQEASSAPTVLVNGVRKVKGTGPGGNTTEGLMQVYRGHCEDFFGETGTVPVALYWLETEREPGVRARGILRAVVVEDLTSPEDLHLFGVDYKDRLVTRGIRGIGTFYKVIREYQDKGSLLDLGLVERGDWADFEFSFPLAGDTRWREDGMGLVAFVQSASTHEVRQVVHATVE
jgi:hypothetical protein